MWTYIVRRIFYTIPVIFGVAVIVFFLFHMVGGDPTYQMLGQNASAEQLHELRVELGLDQPYWTQFIQFLKQIITFDFGRSYATRQQISDMILEGMIPSLSLALPAFFITLVIAVLIALFVAYFRGRFFDRAVVVACVMGMSISSLAYILFFQKWFAYELGWFPVSGYGEGLFERVQYVALPALIWMTVSLGVDVRFFRTAVLDETYQDYVRTARAKGLSERQIFLKHVLKNSMVPIVTYVVIQIPFLILGSFLLEKFFGIPGLGSITIDAVSNSDFPVLKAMSILFSVLFIFGQLFTDILYQWVDPRVSLS